MAYNGRVEYDMQKARSRQRGIPFLFSFPEWTKWWEDHLGQDWQQKRGSEPDQFCMARKHDSGPYAAWNVDCITNRHNAADGHKNRRGRPAGPRKIYGKMTSAKKREAEELFLRGLTAKAIGKKLGVCGGTVKYHFPTGLVGIMKKYGLSQIWFRRNGNTITFKID